MERRTLPAESETGVADEVQRILDALTQQDPTFRGTARLTFSRPAYELPPNHPLPQQLTDAAHGIGLDPPIVGASFWTDAAVLGHSGTPSVLFGPGGAGLHSTEEYVIVRDVLTCRDALVELAERFCRV
jgi:acetylornithine deacetylase